METNYIHYAVKLFAKGVGREEGLDAKLNRCRNAAKGIRNEAAGAKVGGAMVETRTAPGDAASSFPPPRPLKGIRRNGREGNSEVSARVFVRLFGD